MSDSPLISVITAVYNGARHLERAIESVALQDFDGVEHVVIDGGSTDGSVDIARKHEDRLGYYVSEPDEGIADAFNKGIVASRGKVILFLGADDCLHDDTVMSKVAEEMSRMKAPYFFYGDVNYVYEKSAKRIHRNYNFRKYCRYSCLPHQAMFLDRSFFDKYGMFDTDYRIAMDYEHTARFIRDIQPLHIDILVADMRRTGISTNQIQAHDEMDRARIQHGLASYPSIIISRMLLRAKMAVAGLTGVDW